jgi:hypothetical protein
MGWIRRGPKQEVNQGEVLQAFPRNGVHHIILPLIDRTQELLVQGNMVEPHIHVRVHARQSVWVIQLLPSVEGNLYADVQRI